MQCQQLNYKFCRFSQINLSKFRHCENKEPTLKIICFLLFGKFANPAFQEKKFGLQIQTNRYYSFCHALYSVLQYQPILSKWVFEITMPQTLTLTQPDDWHVHLRDDDLLTHTVPATAGHFARALVMPNLAPPLTDIHSIIAYRNRICAAIPDDSSFIPYMTFYLNNQLTPDAIQEAKPYHFILGAKLYPQGATTNSSQGPADLKAVYPLLDYLQEADLVLQVHGEQTHGDIFDRETLFLTEGLQPILRNFPRLRVVLEHISTKAAVDFVQDSKHTLSATITAHHLLYNRNHLLAEGVRPHYYCLPILKRENDQIALQQAATSGNLKFFAGTDSAPHALENKENACGCAGIFSAPYAVPLYTEIFEHLNQLDKLNDFLSGFGADFYRLPRNTAQMVLHKQPQHIPAKLPFGKASVVPIAANQTIPWSVHAIIS